MGGGVIFVTCCFVPWMTEVFQMGSSLKGKNLLV